MSCAWPSLNSTIGDPENAMHAQSQESRGVKQSAKLRFRIQIDAYENIYSASAVFRAIIKLTLGDPSPWLIFHSSVK